MVSSVTCQICKNWSPVLMLVLRRRGMLVVSSVTYQIWKKLVTSTHAGVREECKW